MSSQAARQAPRGLQDCHEDLMTPMATLLILISRVGQSGERMKCMRVECVPPVRRRPLIFDLASEQGPWAV